MNNNQINLGEIYGLKGDPDERCLRMESGVINFPTLEEIAPYGTANQVKENVSESTADVAFADGNINDRVTFTSENSPNSSATGYMVPISSPMRNTVSIENESPAIQVYNQPYQVNSQSIQYLNSFLRTQIGRMIEVNFLLGSQNLMNLEGRLLAVGSNFILINERNSNNATAIEFFNIKFIRFRY